MAILQEKSLYTIIIEASLNTSMFIPVIHEHSILKSVSELLQPILNNCQ